VVASVLSVNGSARTAKVATMSQIRRSYRNNLKGVGDTEDFQRTCRKLEETLATIQNID
jgi:hypothetical protein